MNDDENTARGGFGPPRAAPKPGVRTTAPVGTPVDPAAPRMQSDRPLHSAGMKGPPINVPRAIPSEPSTTSPVPRTVGGHTARLNVAEPGPVSTPQPPGEPSAPANDSAPAARPAAGGTLRMAPTPSLSPADAQPRPAPAAPAPTMTMTAPPVPPGLAPLPTTGPLPVMTATARAVPDPADSIDWTAPLPVAVGLVFFAIGSLIAIAADNRQNVRGSYTPAAQPTPIVTAAAPPSARASATPAASATTTAASTSSAAPAATPPRPPGVGRQPPPPPSSKGPPSKGRPELPFQ